MAFFSSKNISSETLARARHRALQLVFCLAVGSLSMWFSMAICFALAQDISNKPQSALVTSKPVRRPPAVNPTPPTPAAPPPNLNLSPSPGEGIVDHPASSFVQSPATQPVKTEQPLDLPPASRMRMRACTEEWQKMKLSGAAADRIWRDFAQTCLVR